MRKNLQATEQQHALAHLNISGAGDERVRSESDREALARRLRSGDRSAAAELVDHYYDRIYLFMRAVGHDRQLSEDLTQETFLRAWYHIGQLRDGKALNGWLYRIAGNVSRLYWRKHRKEDLISIDDIDLPAAGVSEPQKAEEHEQFVRVRKAVTRLPWKLKQAVALHYIEDLTISEAAEAAGVRQGTFKSRLNRALNALRKNVG